MTLKEELLSYINPDLLASRDDVEIAKQFNFGRTKIVYCEIGKGKILETIGLASGNKLLDLIDSDSNLRHVKQLVENGWLDIGSPMVRNFLDTLKETLLTTVEVEALKNLAVRDDFKSVSEISEALNG